MKKLLTLFLLLISITSFSQTPRAGGINNLQATVLNTVHDNFVGVQTTNLNSFAVYSFATNFDYSLGLKSTDNLAEGLTNKYFSNTLARNAFSAGTGLTYSAGIYGLDSSTQGLLASISNKFNTPTGSTAQYVRGDGSIVNFPTIPTAQVPSDWNASSGVERILNKPVIPNNTNQLINGAGFLTSFTELDPTVPAYSKTLSAFSVIKTSTDPLYKNISYTPTSLEITNALGFSPLSATGNGSGLTGLLKSQVGLTNVDNTSDASKPISTATQTALNNKQNSVVLTTTGTGAATFNTTTGALNIPTPAIITMDYTNTATVAGGAGNAVFYITSDKTSTGTALYTNVNFVLPIVNDSNANYTYGWSYNPTTKALTVNVKTNVSTNALLNLLGGLVPVLSPPSNVANGVNVSLLVKGS